MRFYIGSDHAAVELRRFLVVAVGTRGNVCVQEIGPASAGEPSDYPDIAVTVARNVVSDVGSFGILICGTGQGMAISANRIPGIRAVVCSEPYSARLGRAHNDANILCVGQRVIGHGVAEMILEAFCSAQFEGGRHGRRVDKINALDRC